IVGAQPLALHASLARVSVVPDVTDGAVFQLPRFKVLDPHGSHLPSSSWSVSPDRASPGLPDLMMVVPSLPITRISPTWIPSKVAARRARRTAAGSGKGGVCFAH